MSIPRRASQSDVALRLPQQSKTSLGDLQNKASKRQILWRGNVDCHGRLTNETSALNRIRIVRVSHQERTGTAQPSSAVDGEPLFCLVKRVDYNDSPDANE